MTHEHIEQVPGPEVPDPSFRAAGEVYIASDDAAVAPLPPGTEVGNVAALKESFAGLHAEMTRLSEHPEERREVAEAFLKGWDPDYVQRRLGVLPVPA